MAEKIDYKGLVYSYGYVRTLLSEIKEFNFIADLKIDEPVVQGYIEDLKESLVHAEGMCNEIMGYLAAKWKKELVLDKNKKV